MRIVSSVAALALLLTPVVPAFAKGDGRIWNPTPEEARSTLLAGGTVCYGERKKRMLTDCMVMNLFKRTLVSSTNVRAIGGLQKNQHAVSIQAVTADGQLVVGEDGSPAFQLNNVAVQENAAVIKTAGAFQFLSAAGQGLFATGLNAAFGPCSGGGCNSGGGSVAYAISGAEASSALNAAINGAGCGTACTPAHTVDGPGSAPYKPGG